MPLALAYIMVVCVALYVLERVAGITEPDVPDASGPHRRST